MGEGSPLYDPGSDLYYWEGESSASITINGMRKRKEVKCITAAVIIRYPSKLHRSTRSGPTAVVYYAIGPCTTSLITGQYRMIVIELAELLSEWWFPLSIHEPRPSRSIEGWVTLCGVVSRQGVKRNARVPRGWGIRIKSQQYRQLPHFFLS